MDEYYQRTLFAWLFQRIMKRRIHTPLLLISSVELYRMNEWIILGLYPFHTVQTIICNFPLLNSILMIIGPRWSILKLECKREESAMVMMMTALVIEKKDRFIHKHIF